MTNIIGGCIENTLLSKFSHTHKINISEVVVVDILEEVFSKEVVNNHLRELNEYHSLTYNHCVSTAILAITMGDRIGLEREDILDLAIAAILHDVGKINVPKNILDKRGVLTDVEYKAVVLHVLDSYSSIQTHKNISIRAKGAILEHHERMDGSGYPFGIRKRDISLFGKILAIVDVYDALVSDRPYHRRYSEEEALLILYTDRNKFDLSLLEVFNNLVIRNKEYKLGVK